MLPVKQHRFIIKPDLPTYGCSDQIGCPVMPHAVHGLNLFLCHQYSMTHHHGVAAGNVLHQCVAKAGRAANARAQANGFEQFIHKLCAPAIKAHSLISLFVVPLHCSGQFLIQPHIILIGKRIQVLWVVCFDVLDQVKKVVRRAPLWAMQNCDRLADLLRKLADDVQGVIGRSIVTDGKGPRRMGLACDGLQLLLDKKCTVVGGQQDVHLGCRC